MDEKVKLKNFENDSQYQDKNIDIYPKTNKYE